MVATPHLHQYIFKALPGPCQHILHTSWPSTSISPVSHSQVPIRGPTSLLKQIFSCVPASAPQHHWFLTMAHIQPCAPHPTPVGEEISSSSKLTSYWTYLKRLQRNCTWFAVLQPLHLPDMMWQVGRKHHPHLCMAAIPPHPSISRLCSTPRPDLALFRAAFLTQTFESDLEPKTNRKANTLPNTLFFFNEKGWHPVLYLCVLKSKMYSEFLTAWIWEDQQTLKKFKPIFTPCDTGVKTVKELIWFGVHTDMTGADAQRRCTVIKHVLGGFSCYISPFDSHLHFVSISKSNQKTNTELVLHLVSLLNCLDNVFKIALF